jgi:hypothetical protein
MNWLYPKQVFHFGHVIFLKHRLSSKRTHFKYRQAYRKNDEADNNSHNQYHDWF